MDFKPRIVTIHCSDTPNGLEISLDHLKKDHIARGFDGIGYHAVIQPDGTLYQTRPLNQKGMHVAGHNSDNAGICLAGTNQFTMEQFNKLWSYLDTLRLAFSLKAYNIFSHYEFDSARKQGKTCPNIRSADIVHWYMTMNTEAIEKYILQTEN